eukprot:738779-Rhodomonas_salina.2
MSPPPPCPPFVLSPACPSSSLRSAILRPHLQGKGEEDSLQGTGMRHFSLNSRIDFRREIRGDTEETQELHRGSP